MEGQQRSILTVQGIGYPMPAAERGVQAGPQPSKYGDRNASVVANLATVADNTTRNNNSEELLQEGNPFARRCRVNRSPQGESPAKARPKTQLHNDKAKELPIKRGSKRRECKRLAQKGAKANENSSSSGPDVGEQSTPLRNEEGGTWKKVYRKKHKPKDMPKANSKDKLKTRLLKERPKKDAIIIAASGEQSYADVLRKVKMDDKLSSYGQAVERIRKDAKG
ncbi:hypothetical protein ACLKA6_003659 [Drosophila palustris]